MSLRRLANRWLALIRKDRLDRELDDEVLAHLELAEQDGIARGLTPEEARREARRAFGGIEQMKERHREDRSARWIALLLSPVSSFMTGHLLAETAGLAGARSSARRARP